MRSLLRRVFDHQGIEPKTWYVPIIFLSPAIFLLTCAVTRLTGLPLPHNPYPPFRNDTAAIRPVFVLATGEEVGWTGYVTYPMQGRWSALTTGMILGEVGAMWHFVPLIQMDRTPIWIAWWALSSAAVRTLTVYLHPRSTLRPMILHPAPQ